MSRHTKISSDYGSIGTKTDCICYTTNRRYKSWCSALQELTCKHSVCPFYKPKDKYDEFGEKIVTKKKH